MKKFSFSFQYLLDAHRAKEQAAEYALHKAAAARAETESMLKTLTETREQQTQVFEEMQGVVRRADYTAYLRAIDVSDQEVAGLEKERCKQIEVVEGCRTALRKEVTSRRILENLFEREKNEWADALQSEEQKQMDELAVVRWSRQESRA